MDPANFSRYNDGIIQASILRAAKAEELCYNIDNDLSQEMTRTLETIIKYNDDEQGEALLEFLYAIAIKKLTIKRQHLKSILELLTKCDDAITQSFTRYIEKYIYEAGSF